MVVMRVSIIPFWTTGTIDNSLFCVVKYNQRSKIYIYAFLPVTESIHPRHVFGSDFFNRFPSFNVNLHLKDDLA